MLGCVLLVLIACVYCLGDNDNGFLVHILSDTLEEFLGVHATILDVEAFLQNVVSFDFQRRGDAFVCLQFF